MQESKLMLGSETIRCLRRVALLSFCVVSNLFAADESIIVQAIAEYSIATETTDRDLRIQAFARAEQLFRQAVEHQRQAGSVVNTELLVNLGNAALQAEHLGAAIVAFRQALLQNPSHHQAAQNLQFARSLLPESFRINQSTQLVDTLFFWRAMLSARQIEACCGFSFLLFSGFIALGIARKSSTWRNLALVPLLLWFVLWASLQVPNVDQALTAVITFDDTLLYSADSENSAPRLSDALPNGTEVRVLEQRDRWTEIQVRGRSGWVRSTQLSFVSSSGLE